MGKKYYYLNPVKAALARRRRILHSVEVLGGPLLFLLVVAVGGILAPHSYAASYTWDGGGATNNWSDCDNWSTNICPVAADSVTFNATSTKDSVVDVGFGGTVLSMGSASTYTGTITFSRDLVVGAFGLAGGTVDLGSQTIRSSGAFSLGTGVIFNAGTGTVVFTGSTATITCNNAVFNRVEFQNTGTKTVSSGCDLPLGANPTIGHNLNLSGTLSGSGTLSTTTGTLTLQSSATLLGFDGFAATSSHLTINGANLDFTGFTTFVLAGIYTQTGGDVSLPNGADLNSTFLLNSGAAFTAPSGVLSVAGNFTINSGATFNANGGTIVFDGAGNLTCNGAVFNLVQFTYAGSSAKTVNDGCNLPLGVDPIVSSRLALSGTLSGSGTLTFGGVVNTMQPTGALTGFTGFVGPLSIQGATVDFGAYTLVDFTTFAMTAGSFTAPAGTMTVSSTFNITGGAFNANGGIVNFDLTSATITCNNAVFHLVSFANNISGTKTVGTDCNMPLGHDPAVRAITLNGTLSGTGTLSMAVNLTLNSAAVLDGFNGLTVGGIFINDGATTDLSDYSVVDFNGPFTLSSGTVIAPSGVSTFASSFTLSGGTFNANGGTVVFDGVTATLSCNNVDFYLVVFQNTGIKTVSSNCILALGHDPLATGTGSIILNGYITGSGKLYKDAGSLTLNNPNALSMFDEIDVAGLTVNTDQDWSSNQKLKIRGTYLQNSGVVSAALVMESAAFTVNAGIFTAPPGSLSISGDFTFSADATFNHNSGTVVLTPTGGTRQHIRCNGVVFNLVILQYPKSFYSGCRIPLGHNPTVGTLPFGWNYYRVLDGAVLVGTGKLTVSNDSGYGFQLVGTGTVEGFDSISTGRFMLAQSTFDASNLESIDVKVGPIVLEDGSTLIAPPVITSAGDWIVDVTSNIDPAGGSVFLIGTDQTLTGDIEFHSLTKTTAGILTVGAGNTITTTGLFKLSGPSLVSSAPGSVWNINMQGSTNICYVSVTDSNSVGNAVVAYQSESYGANVGWVFLNSACPGSGGGGGGSGGGGEPVSTVTNYTNAQAAATAVGIASTSPNTTLPPYYGLPSTLAKTVDSIPGSRDALRAFLRFVGITGLIMLLTGGVIWFVASKRRKDEDDQLPAHWNGTRVG